MLIDAAVNSMALGAKKISATINAEYPASAAESATS
jgi:hypothetical protein